MPESDNLRPLSNEAMSFLSDVVSDLGEPTPHQPDEDESPPEPVSVTSSGNLDETVRGSHSSHPSLPDGVPHIPGFMFCRMKIERPSGRNQDYPTILHHMFNYLAVANGIPEDSYEIVSSISEHPEFGFDLVFAVCLIDCDGHDVALDTLTNWLDYFFADRAPTDEELRDDHTDT